MASRLNEHVNEHNLSEVFQSAYKKGHSTESALFRVHNDILRAIDNGGCEILLLLDLSAAFDTVDHGILLSRLRDRFGVSGTALAWFQSYLSSLYQLMGNGPLGVVFPAEFLRDLYWGPFFIFCILRHWETYVENMDFLFICMQMIHRFILSLNHS